MKHVNFKNGVIALAIGLLMVSCSGGSSNKGIPTTKDGKIDAEAVIAQQIKESATQTEITAANWQSVVKSRFGIDLAVPQGWAFSDVRSYFSGETVIVIFKQEGDDATHPREIARTIFNAVKAVSSEGNFEVDVKINEAGTSGTTSKGKVYETYDNCDIASKLLGEDYINGFWYYVKNGIKVVTLGSDKGKFSVKFEFSKVTI